MILVHTAYNLAKLYLLYLAIAIGTAVAVFGCYELVVFIQVVPLELEIAAVGFYVVCVWLRKPLGGPYINIIVALYGSYVLIPAGAAFLFQEFTSLGKAIASDHYVISGMIHWFSVGGLMGAGVIIFLEYIGILSTPESIRDRALERAHRGEEMRRRKEAEMRQGDDNERPVR